MTSARKTVQDAPTASSSTPPSASTQNASPRSLGPALFVGLALLLFAVGSQLRGGLALDFDTSSVAALQGSLGNVRAWVESLGAIGPIIYLGILTFRVFLLLPSWVALTIGGLAFGMIGGTLLGSVGIFLSAVLSFALARGAGRDALRNSFGERYAAFEERVQRAGGWVVAFFTAHPAAPMTSIHAAAGISSLSLASFAIAVALSGPIRAGAYAVLGSSLVEVDWRISVAIAVGLAGIALIPLAIPSVRAQILGLHKR